MTGALVAVGFGVGLYVLNRVLRRFEREGAFDPQAPSSAARPGLRLFFDYGAQGWTRSGVDQPPARR